MEFSSVHQIHMKGIQILQINITMHRFQKLCRTAVQFYSLKTCIKKATLRSSECFLIFIPLGRKCILLDCTSELGMGCRGKLEEGSWEKVTQVLLKVNENKIYIKVTAKCSPAYLVIGAFVPNDKIFAITQPNTGAQLLKSSEKYLSSQGNSKELTSYCALHSLWVDTNEHHH